MSEKEFRVLLFKIISERIEEVNKPVQELRKSIQVLGKTVSKVNVTIKLEEKV